MGFRFFRRIKIAPGISLNLSKSGGSLSFGPRGAKFTIGSSGMRTTIGLPGTGLYYTQKIKTGVPPSSQRTQKSAPPAPPALRAEDRLNLGFFKRLVVPDDEEALVDGIRELTLGNQEQALAHLQKALHFEDGAFVAGVIYLKKNQLESARENLNRCLTRPQNLGKYFRKYGIRFEVKLPITRELSAHIEPDQRGVLLALTEVYQRLEKFWEAENCLRQLIQLWPEDPVARLSLVELLFTRSPEDKKTCQEVVRLLEGIHNESEIHTALLFYKAKALNQLGLRNASLEILNLCLRQTKERSPELLRALRYERALVYEALDKSRKARTELEKIYMEAPDYEDVAKRLGI